MKINCLHPRVILHYKALSYIIRYKSFYLAGKLTNLDETRLEDVSFYKLYPAYIPERHKYHGKIPYADYIQSILTDAINENYVIDYITGESFPIFQIVPCGRCRCCREKRFQEWTTRIIMESQLYDFPPLFFTLTYDSDHLPSDGYLKKDHIQKWKKRFLKQICDDGLSLPRPDMSPRLFVCGEYGSKEHRPHYHVLLWNYPTVRNKFHTLKYVESVINLTWYNGDHPSVKPLDISYSNDAGRYVCKYMHKHHVDIKEKNLLVQIHNQQKYISQLDKSSYEYADAMRVLGYIKQVYKDMKSFYLRPCAPALGRVYFDENLKSTLIQNPHFTEFMFFDRFSGKLLKKPMFIYFKNQLFPSLSRQIRPEVRAFWRSNIHLLNELTSACLSRAKHGRYYTLSKRIRSYALGCLFRLMDNYSFYFDDVVDFKKYRYHCDAAHHYYRHFPIAETWRKHVEPSISAMLEVPDSFHEHIRAVDTLSKIHNAYTLEKVDTSRSVEAYAQSLFRSEVKSFSRELYHTPF